MIPRTIVQKLSTILLAMFSESFVGVMETSTAGIASGRTRRFLAAFTAGMCISKTTFRSLAISSYLEIRISYGGQFLKVLFALVFSIHPAQDSGERSDDTNHRDNGGEVSSTKQGQQRQGKQEPAESNNPEKQDEVGELKPQVAHISFLCRDHIGFGEANESSWTWWGRRWWSWNSVLSLHHERELLVLLGKFCNLSKQGLLLFTIWAV